MKNEGMTVFFRKIRSAKRRIKGYFHSQRFGVQPSDIYSEYFYESGGCVQGKQTASLVVDVLIRTFNPASVFDVGCGSGFYLSEFTKRGIGSYGCEGSEHGVRRCSSDCFVFQHDLRIPLKLNRRFGFVMCIEVAEHLPATSAKQLIQSIADLSQKDVLFCASLPGEKGDDHINCQPSEYWIKLFSDCGFVFDPQSTERLRHEFTRISAPRWLCEWPLVLKRQGSAI